MQYSGKIPCRSQAVVYQPLIFQKLETGQITLAQNFFISAWKLVVTLAEYFCSSMNKMLTLVFLPH